jgi:hypothetical protein
MASTFIGLNRGQTGALSSDFTIGASTGATDLEVRIDTGKSLTREDAKLMLEAITRIVEAVDPLVLVDFAAPV